MLAALLTFFHSLLPLSAIYLPLPPPFLPRHTFPRDVVAVPISSLLLGSADTSYLVGDERYRRALVRGEVSSAKDRQKERGKGERERER